jgi:hypothetical protein
MKGYARVLAAISLFLFILTATVALTLVNIRLFLLSPETYSQAFKLEGVYDEIPAIAADQLRYSMSFNPCFKNPELCEKEGTQDNSLGGLSRYLVNVPAQVWESVISVLIDASWVEDQIEAVLGQFFSILMEEAPSDAIVISLEDIKNRIEGNTAYQAIVDVMSTQPECTVDQITALIQALTSEDFNDAIVRCNPPMEVLQLVEPYVRSGLEEIVGMLPSRVVIEIPPELNSPRGSTATILSIFRGLFRYAPWIAAFWLLALSIFIVRDLRSWLGWWGIGLFMTGFSTLAIGLTLGQLVGWSQDRIDLSQTASDFSPTLMSAAMRVADNIMNDFSLRLLTQAGILLGVGLLMIIIRMIARPGSNGQIGTRLIGPRSSF